MPPAPCTILPPDVQRVNPLEDADWDAKLSAIPSASFFHGSAWARVLHETYGYRPVYFVAGLPATGPKSQVSGPKSEASNAGSDPPVDKGPEPVLQSPGEGGTCDLRPATSDARASALPPAPCSLLPVMEVDSWLTGRRGVSLPFTDECAPLLSDATAFQRLFQAALDHGQARRWKYLEFRGGQAHFGDSPSFCTYWGHRLELQRDEGKMFSQFDSAVRRAVRKAEKSELEIEVSTDLPAVRDFHRLLCKTRRRHGVPPQPFGFFRNVQRRVLAEHRGFVVLARHRGVAVAGAVYFHSGATGVYKYGASDEQYQHLRGNNLVMWTAIRRLAQMGLTILDFGRTGPENDGLRQFKISWGTKETRLDYHRYDCRLSSFVAGREDSTGWYNAVFRRLPVPMSRFIGAALYRHIG